MGTFFNYEKLKKGFTGAVTVAAGAVTKGLEVAKDLAEDLTSFKALKDYKLAGHVATAGPGGCWRIFSAVNKKPGAVFPEAAVWILDKKALTDQASRAGRARGFDTFFEQQRRGATQMLRLKHPGVIKVIAPLEEAGGQMVMVTEPVFGSLADVLGRFRDVPSAPQERAGVVLSPLEAKYGLQCLSETLHFLHHEAHLVHCNIHPGSIIVARDGGWKLAGFEFVASSADGFGGSSSPQQVFEYPSAHPSPWEQYSQPPLGFTAPELVGGLMSSSEAVLSAGADAFSLAALAHLLVTGQELLPVGSSTGEYRSRLRMLGAAPLTGVPGTLQPTLQAMLSSTAAARPNAAAFGGCQWFQEDMLLRCLKFLDTILQRDTAQKVSFLKDLSTLWQQFDDRLLLHRVLPPVVAEMRTEVVALAALPLVLAMLGRMKPEGFVASGILPVLKPIFESADGEVLLALVKHLGVFYSLMPSEAVSSVLVPLMLRAFDSPNTRTQEELLKALHKLAPDMPYSLLKDGLMPRVVGLCLRTTSLVVRVSALGLMSGAVHRLDKDAAGSMLDMCSQIVAVDRSAGTAMAVLQLGDAIGSHYGPDVTACRVLPLLCPLLCSPGLSSTQFTSALTTIRNLLDRLAEKRGGELGAAGAAGSVAAAARRAGSGGSSNRVSAGDLAPDGLFGGGVTAAVMAGSLSADGGAGLGSRVGSGRLGGPAPAAAAAPAWDVPVAASPSSRAAPAAAAGGVAPGQPWSSAAWSSSSTGMMAGSGSSSSWQQQQQQQWQVPSGAAAPAAGGLGVGGGPAPDIFSSAAANGSSSGIPGDLLAGLNLGPGGVGGGAYSSSRAAGQAGSGDLFGGLAVLGQGTANGGSSSSRQQQPPALRPPPSATKPINLLGGAAVGSSSSSGGSRDPFADLAGPGSSSSSAAAFDPFSTLAAGPAGVGGSNKAMNAHRQQPQQQQQQQWNTGGGSLI